MGEFGTPEFFMSIKKSCHLHRLSQLDEFSIINSVVGQNRLVTVKVCFKLPLQPLPKHKSPAKKERDRKRREERKRKEQERPAQPLLTITRSPKSATVNSTGQLTSPLELKPPSVASPATTTLPSVSECKLVSISASPPPPTSIPTSSAGSFSLPAFDDGEMLALVKKMHELKDKLHADHIAFQEEMKSSHANLDALTQLLATPPSTKNQGFKPRQVDSVPATNEHSVKVQHVRSVNGSNKRRSQHF